MLDDLGLVPALQWQAREASKRNGVWVDVSAEDIPDDLREDYKTCVYRVVQEALHNVVQHAHAKKVEVRVARDDRRLLLSIADDGQGFNARMEKGMGLIGMKERVGGLGGRLSIESAPGKGTVLRVELPAV
jgi:signal transduction histidine kinase